MHRSIIYCLYKKMELPFLYKCFYLKLTTYEIFYKLKVGF